MLTCSRPRQLWLLCWRLCCSLQGLSCTQKIDILEDVATAMEHLHGMRVVHGVLTPENVLLGASHSAGGICASVAGMRFSRQCWTTRVYQDPSALLYRQWPV